MPGTMAGCALWPLALKILRSNSCNKRSFADIFLETIFNLCQTIVCSLEENLAVHWFSTNSDRTKDDAITSSIRCSLWLTVRCDIKIYLHLKKLLFYRFWPLWSPPAYKKLKRPYCHPALSMHRMLVPNLLHISSTEYCMKCEMNMELCSPLCMTSLLSFMLYLGP